MLVCAAVEGIVPVGPGLGKGAAGLVRIIGVTGCEKEEIGRGAYEVCCVQACDLSSPSSSAVSVSDPDPSSSLSSCELESLDEPSNSGPATFMTADCDFCSTLSKKSSRSEGARVCRRSCKNELGADFSLRPFRVTWRRDLHSTESKTVRLLSDPSLRKSAWLGLNATQEII